MNYPCSYIVLPRVSINVTLNKQNVNQRNQFQNHLDKKIGKMRHKGIHDKKFNQLGIPFVGNLSKRENLTCLNAIYLPFKETTLNLIKNIINIICLQIWLNRVYPKTIL